MLARDPRHLCLVRLSALGDVCLAVPLVHRLQDAFPGVEIDWVIGKPAHPLVDGFPGVRFHVLDKSTGLRGYLRLIQLLRRTRYDVLLAAQASLRANLIYPWVRAPLKLGFDNARAKDGHRFFVNRSIPPAENHLLAAMLQFGEALGAQGGDVVFRLPIRAEDRAFAGQCLPAGGDSWLAINPAASKPERTWAAGRYAQLANEAIRRWECRVVLTGGGSPSERALVEQVHDGIVARDRVVNLCGKTTPRQLCAVLERARVLVSPDTGPAHLAGAMGTPVVGLFAVMTSRLSSAPGSEAWVVDRYDEAVRTILRRDPGRVPWGTRVHRPGAMDLIPVPAVMERLVAAWGTAKNSRAPRETGG